jgi:hypothetical protein
MSILDATHHDEQQAYGDRDARFGYQRAREQFGGTNRGAVFFGWLTTIAMTVLLGVVAAAFAAVVGTNIDPGSDQVGGNAVAGALILTVVLFAAYATGGYVAGRMCRFDGSRQGMGVWLIGLVSTLAAFGVDVVFGREYRVLQRVALPDVTAPGDLSVLAALTAAMILASTLLGAMAGGALGQRYHAKVDRVRYP